MPSRRNDPEWRSDDPQRWETYYEAWYQIDGAEEVCVNQYCRDARTAKQEASDALDVQLKKIVEVGVRIEAEFWTVKRRHRKQTQTFEPENMEKRGVRMWYGRLQIVSGTLADGS